MLEVEALAVRYGHIRALDGVSLTVAAGEVLAVAGLNGAGKSSLVRAVSGLVRPSAGRVRLEGRDITGVPRHRIEGLALVPEGRVLAPSLTVEETLRLGAGRAGAREIATRRAGVLDRLPVLATRLGQRAGTLSGGEATLLALARALMAAPRLLVLDEPTLGLSPAATARVYETIDALRSGRLAVLLVDENVHRAIGHADRYLILRNGRVAGAGTAAAAPAGRVLEDLLIDSPRQGDLSC